SAILRSTINQLSTPDELRGRMSSINAVFTSSGPQLGQFESGVVAAWLGTEASAMTGGIATLIILAAVAACFPGIRRFQIQPDFPYLLNNPIRPLGIFLGGKEAPVHCPQDLLYLLWIFLDTVVRSGMAVARELDLVADE